MVLLASQLPSQRLLRYDPSELGQFLPFSSICIGTSSKFASMRPYILSLWMQTKFGVIWSIWWLKFKKKQKFKSKFWRFSYTHTLPCRIVGRSWILPLEWPLKSVMSVCLSLCHLQKFSYFPGQVMTVFKSPWTILSHWSLNHVILRLLIFQTKYCFSGPLSNVEMKEKN